MNLNKLELNLRNRIMKKIENQQKMVEEKPFVRFDVDETAENLLACFPILPQKFLDDFELMQKAILAHASCVQFLGDYLKQDTEFAKFVIDSVPGGLKFLAPELRADDYICKYALKKDKGNMKFVDNSIRDILFATILLEEDWRNYKVIPDYLRTNFYLTYLALKHYLNNKRKSYFTSSKSIIKFALKTCKEKILVILTC